MDKTKIEIRNIEHVINVVNKIGGRRRNEYPIVLQARSYSRWNGISEVAYLTPPPQIKKLFCEFIFVREFSTFRILKKTKWNVFWFKTSPVIKSHVRHRVVSILKSYEMLNGFAHTIELLLKTPSKNLSYGPPVSGDTFPCL